MSWRREEPGLFDPDHPRTIDADRRIQIETTGVRHKGTETTFLFKWRWEQFGLSADGPHQWPDGGPRAWMNLRFYRSTDAFGPLEPVSLTVLEAAIEALIFHGENGEALRH
jgi:hypothetical protein